MDGSQGNLLIGPFVGEFGWELTHWSPFARWMARERKRENPETRVLVAARRDRRWWYEDFADEFFPTRLVRIRHARGPVPGRRISWNPRTFWREAGISGEELPATEGPFGSHGKWKKRVWTSLALPGETDSRIMLHYRLIPKGRNRTGVNHREWWKGLPDFLENVGIDRRLLVTIGHPKGADRIPGVEDWRGIPLEELGRRMTCARMVIGTCSGPIHLAQLCETPVIVFGNPRVRDLCNAAAGKANPFHSPTRFHLTSRGLSINKFKWYFPSYEWLAEQIKELMS